MPSPQNREEALFQAAVQLTGAERAAFLNGACLGDNALRKRLEALLAAHEQPQPLLATQAETARPTIKLDFADAPDEAVGQTLGGTAYGDGAKKLRAGLPINHEDFTRVWYFYYSQTLQQEAREVLRGKGIAVPDTETTP